MQIFDVAYVESQLEHGQRIKGPVIYVRETSSTNDEARLLAQRDASEGTIVVAQIQTHGRGRQGRYWFGHPENSLLFSLILRPRMAATHFPRLVTMLAVSAAEGCAAAAGCFVGLKWPNDLIVGSGKCGGILLEAQAPHFAVAGIGVNVWGEARDFPPELQHSATSLGAYARNCLTKEGLLLSIIQAIEKNYALLEENKWEELLARRTKLETLIGQIRTIQIQQTAVTGRIEGISPEGGLIISTTQGLCWIDVGDVL